MKKLFTIHQDVQVSKFLNSARPGVARYLCGIPRVSYEFHNWEICTLNSLTSNPAESVDNWFGYDMRSAGPTLFFFCYLIKLNQLFNKRYSDHSASTATLTSSVESHLEFLWKEARKCSLIDMRAQGVYLGLYSSHLPLEGDKYRTGHIPEKTCSCGEWQDTQKPCMHALAVAFQSDIDYMDWIPLAYRRTTCLKLYTQTITIIPTRDVAMGEEVIVENYENQRSKKGHRGGKRKEAQVVGKGSKFAQTA